VVSESGHTLLEGARKGFTVDTVITYLVTHIDGIDAVHHVHAWSITENRRMVTLQARISDDIATTNAIATIKSRLHDEHGIDHATVEIERHVAANG
jgi:cobalt-zinc-cadmium efflux system protein